MLKNGTKLKSLICKVVSTAIPLLISGCVPSLETKTQPPSPSPTPSVATTVSDSARRANLAYQKPVYSSGYWEDGVPERAVDDNIDSSSPSVSWRTNASTGAFLYVDLGKKSQFSRVVVSWGWDWHFGEYGESWIEVSDDAQSWQKVATTKVIRSTSNKPQNLTFPPVTARYVRFYAARWNGGWGYLSTLEVYRK